MDVYIIASINNRRFAENLLNDIDGVNIVQNGLEMGNSLKTTLKEEMRADGRINMYAEADYTEGTTAYMWICNKITEFAERIRKEEKDKIAKCVAIEVPKHLTEQVYGSGD